MKTKINDELIKLVKENINSILQNKTSIENKSRQNQAFSIEFFEALNQLILIPVLVSLTSCALYDFLKGKALSKLKKKEIEQTISNLKEKEIDTANNISDECFEILYDELNPLGMNEQDIHDLYDKILHSIKTKSMKLDK